MTLKQIQQALRKLGWPNIVPVDGVMDDDTFRAVRDFQLAFAFSRLEPDGDPGAKTQEALKQALDAQGRCSSNFKFAEFKSQGNGWVKVARELVLGLEEYREAVGGPVVVVSGYRDPKHNVKVGGAKNSQHLHSNAVDLEPKLTTDQVRRLGRFSGIGVQRKTNLVRHVDVRHIGPNTTGGTVRDPTIWFYA